MGEINRKEGRYLFGLDPAGYDYARPEYPAEIYELLQKRCHLEPGTRTFEIGAGTGLATRRLLEYGAEPLLVVEPDERLASYLKTKFDPAQNRIEMRVNSFEEVLLPAGSFDLGVAATSFHWLDQRTSLRKIVEALRPGGWWAMWWTVFGDPARPDHFHEASKDLFQDLDRSPATGSKPGSPFALDVEARISDLTSTGEFDQVAHQLIRTTAVFDLAKLRKLYATFSEVNRLDPVTRNHLLDQIATIADKQFGGRIEKQIVTAMYTARRR